MPHLVFSAEAQRRIGAIRDFYFEKDPAIAQRALAVILSAVKQLMLNPKNGRPYPEHEHMRELVIPFGTYGFVALYRIDTDGTIVILNIKHQREHGYTEL